MNHFPLVYSNFQQFGAAHVNVPTTFLSLSEQALYVSHLDEPCNPDNWKQTTIQKKKGNWK